MTVTVDLIEDAGVRQDGAGIEVTRRARVRQVEGSALAPRRAIESPGLPRYGDAHPAWSQLKLVDVSLSPVDVTTWDATLTYREPSVAERVGMAASGSVIERQWFAATVTEDVSRDVDDVPMYHWYAGKPVIPKIIGSSVRFAPASTKQLVWKQEKAEVQKPSVGARIVTVDGASVERLALNAGAINAARWSGYPAETWLLGGLNSRQEQGRWVNTFEFFYRPETWQFRSSVEYFGAEPSDATEGNGIAFFNVYRRVNFATFGFTL